MKTYADMLNISWGGPDYSAYAGFGDASGGAGGAGAPASPGGVAAPSTAAPAGQGATPGGSPSPTNGQGGNGNGGQSASPAGQGGQGATPTPGSQPNPNDANIEVLRQSHQTVQRLGGPEKVTAAVERYTKMYDTSKELATALGYTPESFETAFAESPADIYNHLMQEANDADRGRGNGDRGRGQQEPTLQEVIDRQLSPLRNFATRQMAREANTAVDGEFNRLFSEQSLFKGKQVPAEVREAIYNHFTDLVKGDATAQNLILQKGDVSKLLPHFDAAVANMVKFTNSWTKWHTGAPSGEGGNGNQGGQNGGQGNEGRSNANPNPYSLDDIIEGNDVATKAMPSLRGFR